MRSSKPCRKCGSSDVIYRVLSGRLFCTKCQSDQEEPRANIHSISYTDPVAERPARSTSHEKWVWLILAIIMLGVFAALGR